jgi:hypothetical protein
MPLRKGPKEHPRLDDFNRLYGARHVKKLAQAHKRLKRRFRLGDHVEHVSGVETRDIREWRVHMRLMPPLMRTLMEETIHNSLSADKPAPIQWVLRPRMRNGWAVSVTERGGRLVVEIAPPPLRDTAARRSSRAK